MLEQPPPGPDDLEEMPPPGWRGISKKQFWCWMVALPVAVLMLLLLSAPMFLKSAKASERTEAISNSKQVGLAMLEFDQEYGSFPSDATVADVVKVSGSSLDFSGGSSNAMFRQLIACGLMSEDIFYCMHPEGTRKPDKLITPGFALAAREVGFSYVHGLNTGCDVNTPLLMAPMVTSTSDEFWPRGKGWGGKKKAFGGKAVILQIDNSARTYIIRPSDRKVTVGGGATLLDPSGAVWGGKKPEVRHPKF